MGLKSEFYDLAGKIDSKCDEIERMITELGSIKSELSTVKELMKTKADHIKDDQPS
jgi:hypothetical protein